jgi:hypothetical protein
MENFILEAAALVIIVITCWIHAIRFQDNIPITAAFHGFWLAVYCALCVGLIIISPSWWLAIALVTLRAVLYNQILNGFRGLKWFYIHGESEHGSWFDRQLERIGIFYPILWCLSVVFLVYVNARKL